jgi:hypothetical protein
MLINRAIAKPRMLFELSKSDIGDVDMGRSFPGRLLVILRSRFYQPLLFLHGAVVRLVILSWRNNCQILVELAPLQGRAWVLPLLQDEI